MSRYQGAAWTQKECATIKLLMFQERTGVDDLCSVRKPTGEKEKNNVLMLIILRKRRNQEHRQMVYLYYYVAIIIPPLPSFLLVVHTYSYALSCTMHE